MVTRFSSLAIAALAAGGLACSAQATFFSFASDVNSNSYTLGGSAGILGAFSITDFSRPNTFVLLVDDNNGVLPTKSVAVEFRAALTASTGLSTNIVGNLWQHSYRVSGTFGFYDSMGAALLTVAVGTANPALFTVPGSQTTWSSTGAVLGANTFSDITYTASAAFVTALGGTATAANYGIAQGALGLPTDFAFDLSAINGGSLGQAVVLDPTTKAPISTWRSESSYSGTSGGIIPTPASATLMGLGVLLSVCRRRRGNVS